MLQLYLLQMNAAMATPLQGGKQTEDCWCPAHTNQKTQSLKQTWTSLYTTIIPDQFFGFNWMLVPRQTPAAAGHPVKAKQPEQHNATS